jgi:ABC-2 family transporter protein
MTTPLSAALWAEALKLHRSRVPWVTAAVLALTPLMAGLFVLAARDPQTPGLAGGKTQMLGVTADWAGYFTLLTQIAAVGGLLALGVVTAWVFGREFSDRMAVDLLALPTSRAAIITAKFLLIVAWSAVATALVPLVAAVVGGALGLPGWSTSLLWETVGHLAGPVRPQHAARHPRRPGRQHRPRLPACHRPGPDRHRAGAGHGGDRGRRLVPVVGARAGKRHSGCGRRDLRHQLPAGPHPDLVAPHRPALTSPHRGHHAHRQAPEPVP